MMKVSVIGCGSMGSAILEGLAERGSHELLACDCDTETLEGLDKPGVKTSADIRDAEESDVVVLAVKPRSIGLVEKLSLGRGQLLVSVAAGVRIDELEQMTDAAVARLMPNLAVRHGKMAAAVTFSRSANSQQRNRLKRLMAELGVMVEVDEELMDLSTAVNGSGPAYVFRLMQSFVRYSENQGLGSEKAEKLVSQTFLGAAKMVTESDRSLEEYIEAVCSEGGTTIEGMKVLRREEVGRAIREALERTEAKSRSISGSSGSSTKNCGKGEDL